MYARRFVVAGCLALLSAVVLAEEPPGAPKPGPEHKKLEYFVGKWDSTGELKENPFMPVGEVKSIDECEWFEGGFALVCHGQGTGPLGEFKSLGIQGYSTEEQAYTYYGLDSGPTIMTTVALGKVDGNTWTYTDEARMGGEVVKSRFTIKVLEDTDYDYRWETMNEDGSWTTVMTGHAFKIRQPR